MSFVIENLPESIKAAKAELRAALPQYKDVFRGVEAGMRKRVDEIVKERNSGQEVIPIVQYADIANDRVAAELIEKIKSRGACVIRGTFPKEQAMAWDQQVAQYVEENHLDAKLANAAEDKYFGTLASAKPQIYGVYWSKPQVEARQSEQHTHVRVFLNRLWQSESTGIRHVDPDQTPVYADRMRRRPPQSPPSACRPTWTVVRWNVGLNQIFGKSTATYFLETGRSTTRTMQPTAPMCRKSLHLLSALCSALSRAGRL